MKLEVWMAEFAKKSSELEHGNVLGRHGQVCGNHTFLHGLGHRVGGV
eukprot:CAMPEP_0114303524 /NCGR_PEP_ID=MMETSP0059-20121206/15266_1 /TAXON_ID=36894 /ORGANISM="Pyramimonas parkeae, Strain CCMP726" /LENGTH=46 /DNA_ID= /DNA_START= /DNA_END= /DNA_ORIENTATION=